MLLNSFKLGIRILLLRKVYFKSGMCAAHNGMCTYITYKNIDLFKLSISDKIWSIANVDLIISHPIPIAEFTLSYARLCKPCSGYMILWDPCTLLIASDFLKFSHVYLKKSITTWRKHVPEFGRYLLKSLLTFHLFFFFPQGCWCSRSWYHISWDHRVERWC